MKITITIKRENDETKNQCRNLAEDTKDFIKDNFGIELPKGSTIQIKIK